MNIFALKGYRVKVTEKTANNGTSSDKEKVKELLEVDKVYTVDHTDVHASNTNVYLIEFPDVVFNSSSFEGITIQPRELTMYHKDVITTVSEPTDKEPTLLDLIKEAYIDENIQSVPGLDDAVIGIATDFSEPRLVYSVKKCIKIFMKDMDYTDAMEMLTFNYTGGYLGERTPVWSWDDFE